jgi:enoyl-CoA hydratase
MPETGIGLFPDVGGGWYLARIGNRLGQYLALTGARLDGAECIWAGLCTHYLPAGALPEAKQRIAAGEDIAHVLDALAIAPPEPRIAASADLIAKHFASDHYEDILASLEADGGEWAAKECATLRAKSPQACKVSLRQLAEAARLDDFAANMAMEYRIGSRVLTLPDFAEGVRAVLVDKTQDPKWLPARPEDVSDALIDSIFAPLPPGEEWVPL